MRTNFRGDQKIGLDFPNFLAEYYPRQTEIGKVYEIFFNRIALSYNDYFRTATT